MATPNCDECRRDIQDTQDTPDTQGTPDTQVTPDTTDTPNTTDTPDTQKQSSNEGSSYTYRISHPNNHAQLRLDDLNGLGMAPLPPPIPDSASRRSARSPPPQPRNYHDEPPTYDEAVAPHNLEPTSQDTELTLRLMGAANFGEGGAGSWGERKARLQDLPDIAPPFPGNDTGFPVSPSVPWPERPSNQLLEEFVAPQMTRPASERRNRNPFFDVLSQRLESMRPQPSEHNGSGPGSGSNQGHLKPSRWLGPYSFTSKPPALSDPGPLRDPPLDTLLRSLPQPLPDTFRQARRNSWPRKSQEDTVLDDPFERPLPSSRSEPGSPRRPQPVQPSLGFNDFFGRVIHSTAAGRSMPDATRMRGYIASVLRTSADPFGFLDMSDFAADLMKFTRAHESRLPIQPSQEVQGFADHVDQILPHNPFESGGSSAQHPPESRDLPDPPNHDPKGKNKKNKKKRKRKPKKKRKAREVDDEDYYTSDVDTDEEVVAAWVDNIRARKDTQNDSAALAKSMVDSILLGHAQKDPTASESLPTASAPKIGTPDESKANKSSDLSDPREPTTGPADGELESPFVKQVEQDDDRETEAHDATAEKHLDPEREEGLKKSDAIVVDVQARAVVSETLSAPGSPSSHASESTEARSTNVDTLIEGATTTSTVSALDILAEAALFHVPETTEARSTNVDIPIEKANTADSAMDTMLEIVGSNKPGTAETPSADTHPLVPNPARDQLPDPPSMTKNEQTMEEDASAVSGTAPVSCDDLSHAPETAKDVPPVDADAPVSEPLETPPDALSKFQRKKRERAAKRRERKKHKAAEEWEKKKKAETARKAVKEQRRIEQEEAEHAKALRQKREGSAEQMVSHADAHKEEAGLSLLSQQTDGNQEAGVARGADRVDWAEEVEEVERRFLDNTAEGIDADIAKSQEIGLSLPSQQSDGNQDAQLDEDRLHDDTAEGYEVETVKPEEATDDAHQPMHLPTSEPGFNPHGISADSRSHPERQPNFEIQSDANLSAHETERLELQPRLREQDIRHELPSQAQSNDAQLVNESKPPSVPRDIVFQHEHGPDTLSVSRPEDSSTRHPPHNNRPLVVTSTGHPLYNNPPQVDTPTGHPPYNNQPQGMTHYPNASGWGMPNAAGWGMPNAAGWGMVPMASVSMEDYQGLLNSHRQIAQNCAYLNEVNGRVLNESRRYSTENAWLTTQKQRDDATIQQLQNQVSAESKESSDKISELNTQIRDLEYKLSVAEANSATKRSERRVGELLREQESARKIADLEMELLKQKHDFLVKTHELKMDKEKLQCEYDTLRLAHQSIESGH
ncbi:hypothetical protein GGR53DRAFT_465572 [Hypoxylon sp. FL1150]|nr:hypothetical protein GGR53DRAFT_465572 [Hypoxylon sp. FL1150]